MKQQEKQNLIKAMLEYYKFMKKRFNNGFDYIESMAQNHTSLRMYLISLS